MKLKLNFRKSWNMLSFAGMLATTLLAFASRQHNISFFNPIWLGTMILMTNPFWIFLLMLFSTVPLKIRTLLVSLPVAERIKQRRSALLSIWGLGFLVFLLLMASGTMGIPVQPWNIESTPLEHLCTRWIIVTSSPITVPVDKYWSRYRDKQLFDLLRQNLRKLISSCGS